MKSSAPCKVILFGEHAVVYDKLGIAAAIGEKTFVEISPGEDGVEIYRKLEPTYTKVSKEELFEKLAKFREIYSAKEFAKLQEFSFVDSLLVVIAECMQRFGYKPIRVDIKFDNVLKGVGRSASKYSAIATSVSNFLGKKLSVDELREISYLGDVIAHAGMPSGIDTSVISLGGYISYKKSEGVKKIDIDYSLPLVVVDSGEKAKTSVAVANVKQMREENPAYVDSIMEEIDSISNKAIKSLQEKNLEHVGALMSRNHELLRRLNVSTPKLDSIVQFAVDNEAYGAKLTAAGQGGCAIVLAKDQEHAQKLCDSYKEKGFFAFTTMMGVEGTKIDE